MHELKSEIHRHLRYPTIRKHAEYSTDFPHIKSQSFSQPELKRFPIDFGRTTNDLYRRKAPSIILAPIDWASPLST